MAFCGHATIATAVAVAERLGTAGSSQLLFDTLAGPVPVAIQLGEAGATATLTSVATRTRPAQDVELDRALRALRWQRSDLYARYPPQVAYAGNDHLVLALRDRGRLAELDYDYGALAVLMAEWGWTTLQLVHAHSPVLFAARNPFPPGGVVEDPATGAAAAALGGYLRALGLVDLPAQVTVLQGQEMGRPSRLVVDISLDDNRVRVTGAAAALPDA